MSDEGATPRELLLESARRNNTSLLLSLLTPKPTPAQTTQIAQLLNTSTDALGAHILHIAASNGSYDVLDILLDQEGLEVDPIDRLEGDTPLHKAVRWINGLAKGEWADGEALVELLLDAGADPRVRNKARLKAGELVDPRNEGLRKRLERAEFVMLAGGDVVQEEDGPTGSASDSE